MFSLTETETAFYQLSGWHYCYYCKRLHEPRDLITREWTSGTTHLCRSCQPQLFEGGIWSSADCTQCIFTRQTVVRG